MFGLGAALHSCLIVIPGGNEMGQYPASVDAFPLKGVVRHFIKFIPADLGGHEIRNIAFLEDLGQSCGITEDIRQPQNGILLSELIPEKFLAVYELAHQGFSGSNVAVCFYEHTAFRLPSAFCHTFFDLLINFRRVFLHVFVKLRLAGHKDVFRILLHQIQHGGKASHRLIFRYLQSPQPRAVNVGMSHTAYHRTLLGIAVLLIKLFCDKFLGFFQAFIIFRGTFSSHIQQIQRIVQRLDNGNVRPVFRI